MWSSLVTALRFLTIIPVPARWAAPHYDVKPDLSLLFYPLVGLLLGLLLLGVCVFSGIFSPALQALFVVMVWVLLTGGLHLDGVADSADAWLGGHGDRERTLAILRDTSVGVAAVLALILTLALKVLLLAELMDLKLQAIVIAPIIGRSMVLLLFNTTAYVRGQGIASTLIASLPRQRINLILFALMIIVIGVLSLDGLLMLFCVLVGFLVLRYLMVRRLGGTTGDTAGALIEFGEILVLFGLVLAEKLL